MRKLGTVQESVLRTIIERGYWFAGCGWKWDTHSGTKRIMDSLKRQGAVFFDPITKRYYPTTAAVNGRFTL